MEAIPPSDGGRFMPMLPPARSSTGTAATNAGGKPPGNRLIAALPHAAGTCLTRAGKRVALTPGTILCEPGQRIRHAWFPLDGFISLSTAPGHVAQMDMDLLGNEGMLGTELMLGVPESSQRALVLGAGTALRLSAVALRRELQRGPSLRRLLNRYVHVLMLQLAQNATCAASHRIEQRLARLLLTSQDRAGSGNLNITQAALAALLGVRRVGVTEAAGALQRRGFIRYSRGHLAIVDRTGLDRAACGCYRAASASRQRWLG